MQLRPTGRALPRTFTDCLITDNDAGGGVLAEDLALSCVGDPTVDGIGIFDNISDAKRSELRLEGRAATAIGDLCDLASEDAGALGIISVESAGDFDYGPDATFACDSLGCLP